MKAMSVLIAYHTDVGAVKKTNQDSLCIQVAETPLGMTVMAVVCDGMGGLAKGELASASVIRAFKRWFDTELAEQLSGDFTKDVLYRWRQIINEQNQRIAEYGRRFHIQLGTTLTALLAVGAKFLLIGHVGDTRVYRVADDIEQMTEDQTVVGREVRKGALTPAQAEADPRRNVLLQCIGASKNVEPQFIKQCAAEGETYLVCSDGFRHMITERELYDNFRPERLTNESDMSKRIRSLIEINKLRGERDNITAALVKL